MTLGELYQDIFIEYSRCNLTKLVQDSDTSIPSILVQLMRIGTVAFDDLNGTSDERIRARYQTSFWKEFLRELSKLGSQAYLL